MERDILLKMNISNNSKIFLDACYVSFDIHSPSSSYIRNAKATVVVNIVLAIAGTILNSFVLYIFLKSRKLRSKLSSFAIMLLCSIDLGVGTVANPLFALKDISTILGSPKCLYFAAYNIAILFFSGISGCTIFIINIERYFAIMHPFFHHVHFTKRRFVLTWVFSWFLVIVFILCLVYFPFLGVLVPVTLGIITFTSLFTYIAIFVVARKRMLNINEVHSNSDQESRRNLMVFLIRELKIAKTYVLIVSLCFLCYLPTVVVSCVESILNLSVKTSDSLVNAFDWGNTFITLNSTLNCLIFFWGNREMRKEGSKIAKKCFHRQEDRQFELNVVQM